MKNEIFKIVISHFKTGRKRYIGIKLSEIQSMKSIVKQNNGQNNKFILKLKQIGDKMNSKVNSITVIIKTCGIESGQTKWGSFR